MSKSNESYATQPMKASVASTRTPVEIREGRSISVIRVATRGISSSDRDVMAVFFHGSMASVSQFRGYFNDPLLASVNVAGYDALGCGQASKPSGYGNSLYTEDEMVADGEAFLKLLQGAGNSPALTRDLRGSVSGSLTSSLRFVIVGHSFGTVVALRVARAAAAAGYDLAGVLLLGTALECPAAAKHPIFGLPDCCLGCLQGNMSADFASRSYHELSDPDLVDISRSASDRNPWEVIKPFYDSMHWGIHLAGTGKVALKQTALELDGRKKAGRKSDAESTSPGDVSIGAAGSVVRGAADEGLEEGGPAGGASAEASLTQQDGLGPAALASMQTTRWGIPGVPVLVLHGETDGILPLDGARALASRFWEEADAGGASGALPKRATAGAGGGGGGGGSGGGGAAGSEAGSKAGDGSAGGSEGSSSSTEEGASRPADSPSSDERYVPYGLDASKMLQMAREAVGVAERRQLWLGVVERSSHQVMEERPQLVSAFVRALADRPQEGAGGGGASAGAHV